MTLIILVPDKNWTDAPSRVPLYILFFARVLKLPELFRTIDIVCAVVSETVKGIHPNLTKTIGAPYGDPIMSSQVSR
jgi:hypothetical protein